MNNQDDKDNERLNDFLRNKNQEGADDFEKEALAGFAMLNNEQEALDLKRSVDQQLKRGIFEEKSPNSSRKYWYAAAGLLLCIGFSIYFIQTHSPNPKQELAIESHPAPLEKQMEPTLRETPSMSPNASLPAQGAEPKTKPTLTQKPKDQDSEMRLEASDAEGAHISATDNVVLSAGSKSAENVVGSAAAPLTTGKTSQHNQDDSKEVAAENKAEEESDIVQKDEVEKESKNSDFKRAKAKKTPAEHIAASPSAAYSPPEIGCYYEGGKAALGKELKLKLQQKKLDRSFNARLFINTKNKIEKIELTAPTNFTEVETEKLISLLKDLREFRNRTGKQAEYILEYLP